MKITNALNSSKYFGELSYIRGQVSYRISPFEQRAFAGFFSSLPNVLNRVRGSVLKVVPPFIIGYLIFTETEKKFHQMCRKNPQDYINDK